MKRKGLKSFSLKSGLIILFSTILIVILALMGNALWGNPIRKQMAKSSCLGYFREKYQEEFIIDEIAFSAKLPGYVLTLSPANDPHIQFTCNPNCDPICISDEYGGALASVLLVDQIEAMIEADYADLDFQISASEDPYTWYGGEFPDFFERDPHIRLTKNHQKVSIEWVDPSISRAGFDHMAEDIAGLIEAQLPVVNPNLQVHVRVYPDESQQIERYQADYFLFPTVKTDN